MIEIAPKALRFARLAAEHQLGFRDDPQLFLLRREEDASGKAGPASRTRYVNISDETAEFCVRVVAAFLEDKEAFSGEEWDGNDFVFFGAVHDSLRRQLTKSRRAKAL